MSATQKNGNDLRAALREPLRALAKQNPDGEVRDAAFSFGTFEGAMQSDRALKALGSMSKQDAMQAVREELKQAWPKLSADDLDGLTTNVQRQIETSLRGQCAWKMQKAAVSMMDKTSEAFRGIANDPKAVAQFVNQLDALSSEQKSHFKELYGLNDPTPMNVMNPKVVAERLLARATLIDRESKDLGRTGGDRIFMAVADHDARGAVMKSIGAKEGSWFEGAASAARHQGEEEKTNLTRVKIATSVATAFFTGGLGLTGAAAVVVASGSSMAIGAPALAQAYGNVDAARAGESAGTMAEGAVDTAKANRNLATGGFVLSAVAPVVMGASPAAHAVHHAEAKLAVHVGSEVAAKGAGHAIPHAVIETVETAVHRHAPTGSTGMNAQQKLDETPRGRR